MMTSRDRLIRKITNFLDRIVDPFSIHEWPLKWRRWFVVLLPISGPLWCVYTATLLIGALLLLIITGPIVWIVGLWSDEE